RVAVDPTRGPRYDRHTEFHRHSSDRSGHLGPSLGDVARTDHRKAIGVQGRHVADTVEYDGCRIAKSGVQSLWVRPAGAGDGPYPGVIQLLDGECECGTAIKQAPDPLGGI